MSTKPTETKEEVSPKDEILELRKMISELQNAVTSNAQIVDHQSYLPQTQLSPMRDDCKYLICEESREAINYNSPLYEYMAQMSPSRPNESLYRDVTGKVYVPKVPMKCRILECDLADANLIANSKKRNGDNDLFAPNQYLDAIQQVDGITNIANESRAKDLYSPFELYNTPSEKLFNSGVEEIKQLSAGDMF